MTSLKQIKILFSVLTAKISINIAKKNEGIAIPILEITVKNLSKAVSFLTAARMPRGIPAAQVIKITTTVKSKVFGIRSFSLTETFSPVDVYPKSHFMKDFAHEIY